MPERVFLETVTTWVRKLSGKDLPWMCLMPPNKPEAWVKGKKKQGRETWGTCTQDSLSRCVFAVAVVCEHQVPGFSAFECGLHQQVCRVYKPSASEWVCSIGSLDLRFPDSQTEQLVVFMDSADSSWDYSVSDQLSQLINPFTNTHAHTRVCTHTHTYMSAPWWCVWGGVYFLFS